VKMKQGGFTLIELIVTLAVLAIIASFAAPSLGNMLSQQNLNKSSRELTAILSQARAKAALERREVTVQLNSNALNTPEQLNWSAEGQAVLTSRTTSIVFLPTGLVQGAVGDTTFTICDSATDAQSSRTISISRMGTIQTPVNGDC
jgi:type IV fimbrial biogenesis protein FimT